jgi:uncharacterized membrane protein
LFGTYTLLILQIISILCGGFGVFCYFKLKMPNQPALPFFALIFSLSYFGIYSALAFDYHSVVVAASIIPWFFYFLLKRKRVLTIIFFILTLFAQEDVAILMFFVCLGLIVENRQQKQEVLLLTFLACFALLYFIVVLDVFIPYFSLSKTYTGFCYSSLGNTPKEALLNFFLHPVKDIQILFTNFKHNFDGDYLKIETHVILLVSGVFLLFFKPSYLIMLIPLYAKKFFHDNPAMWTSAYQYSVEFYPIVSIGVFSLIAEISKKWLRILLTTVSLVCTLEATVAVMERKIYYSNKDNIQFYRAKHYQRMYDVKQLNLQLGKIPHAAAVSAESPFVPQLALRNHVYQFPILNDAQFVVYSTKENCYPLSESEFLNLINGLKTSGKWTIQFQNQDFTILRKR